MENKKKLVLLISVIAGCIIIAVLLSVFLSKRTETNSSSLPVNEDADLEIVKSADPTDSLQESPKASIPDDTVTPASVTQETFQKQESTENNNSKIEPSKSSPSNLAPLPPSTETDISIFPKLPATDTDISVTP